MRNKEITPLSERAMKSIIEANERLERINESGQEPITFMGDTYTKYKRFANAHDAKQFAKTDKNYSIIGKKGGGVYVGMMEDSTPLAESTIEKIKKFISGLSEPEIVGPGEQKLVNMIKQLPEDELKRMVGDDDIKSMKVKLRKNQVTRKGYIGWKAAYDVLNESYELGIIEENKSALKVKRDELKRRIKMKSEAGANSESLRKKSREVSSKLASIGEAREQGEEEKYTKDTKKTDDGTGLDPVGKGDADIDNDGDSDKTDAYIKTRRKAIAKMYAKKNVSESYKLGDMIRTPYGKKAKVVKINNKKGALVTLFDDGERVTFSFDELEESITEAKNRRKKFTPSKPTGFRTGDKVEAGGKTGYIRKVDQEGATAHVEFGKGDVTEMDFEELTLSKTAGGINVN